ncbi:hypothetical protein IV203_003930 [Nitzschia inconspicua]|uniref:Uncharacterized protein n=1 Tax=Nitzschia inconspicua TaxID=303405 RepID=A0A9K3L2S7_9STRA|nr:hypothetical protein IV203_003930 [Nitzschia inconspicua]
MVQWTKIARPFFGHFLVNLIKTILGSALVGYGIAQLNCKYDKRIKDVESDLTLSKDPIKKKEEEDLSQLPSPYVAFLERYVSSFVMIGVGLYFSLPSLASQMLWEAAIPAITATEVAQDLATDSVFGYFKGWKPDTGTWPRPKLKLGSAVGVDGIGKSVVASANNFVSEDPR